ncbi:MAG TPA: hypothetical protein VJ793_01955 [Anaerolineae bacterium]|nr:hypothetical protein [Anaerolineae bacterium]
MSSSDWQYIPREQLPRAESDTLVEPHLRAALIRLNPEIAEKSVRKGDISTLHLWWVRRIDARIAWANGRWEGVRERCPKSRR